MRAAHRVLNSQVGDPAATSAANGTDRLYGGSDSDQALSGGHDVVSRDQEEGENADADAEADG